MQGCSIGSAGGVSVEGSFSGRSKIHVVSITTMLSGLKEKNHQSMGT